MAPCWCWTPARRRRAAGPSMWTLVLPPHPVERFRDRKSLSAIKRPWHAACSTLRRQDCAASDRPTCWSCRCRPPPPDRIGTRSRAGPESRAADRDAADVARTPEACTFALVTDRAGFDALEADWNDLFSRAGARHPGLPDLQLELALVQSLPRRAADESGRFARDRHRAPRRPPRHGVAARRRARRGACAARLDGRARQPVRRRPRREPEAASPLLREAWTLHRSRAASPTSCGCARCATMPRSRRFSPSSARLPAAAPRRRPTSILPSARRLRHLRAALLAALAPQPPPRSRAACEELGTMAFERCSEGAARARARERGHRHEARLAEGARPRLAGTGRSAHVRASSPTSPQGSSRPPAARCTRSTCDGEAAAIEITLALQGPHRHARHRLQSQVREGGRRRAAARGGHRAGLRRRLRARSTCWRRPTATSSHWADAAMGVTDWALPLSPRAGSMRGSTSGSRARR